MIRENVHSRAFELLDVATKDLLGEAPWWSTTDQELTRVDIRGRKVRRTSLNGSDLREWLMPEDVGFAVPHTDTSVVVGLRSGLHQLDTGSGAIELIAAVDEDRADHRINDGKTDRYGRLWFGTMHEAETTATAGFYYWDGRAVVQVLAGITTSNGLGWSPDNRVMYHTDSRARQIMAYDFDSELGIVGAGRVFADDPAGYVPDGLTVDTDGCVWSAKWDGGKVVRYAPDGSVDQVLSVPVARPTSCMFVGSDLRVLAVTSAQIDDASDRSRSLDGSVFLFGVNAQGIAEHPVAPTAFTSP